MAFYQIATGANHGLRFTPETVIGETPSTPTMAELSYTGTTLGMSRSELESANIRPDRQVAYADSGRETVGGDISFELNPKEYDPLLAGVLFGEWDDDVLTIGTKLQTFTIESAFTDMQKYLQYVGCAIDKMTLNFSPEAYVTGSFSVVGLSAALASWPLSGSPTPTQATGAFNSFTGWLKIDGEEIAVISSLDLTVENALTAEAALFRRSAVALGYGNSKVSGSLSAYMLSGDTLAQKYYQDVKVSMEVQMQRDGVTYTLLAPRVAFTGLQNPVNSTAKIEQNITWKAAVDPISGKSFQITRSFPTP